MAQFEFKCPQCGETIEADDTFRGQVAECPSCGKGIVIPRTGGVPKSPSTKRLRPVPPPPASNPLPMTESPQMRQYRQMVEEEVARRQAESECRRREKTHETLMTLVKGVAVVLLLAAASGVGLSLWNRAKNAERARQEAEQQAEAARLQAEADQRRQMAEEKKAEAVARFTSDLAREKARLQGEAEAAARACTTLNRDQQTLDDAWAQAEKEVAQFAAADAKRTRKCPVAAERLLRVLKSEQVATLYATYRDAELSGLCTRFENEVKSVLDDYRRTQEQVRRNKANAAAARRANVEQRQQEAAQMSAASRETTAALRSQKKQLAALRARQNRLKRDLQNGRIKRELAALAESIARLEAGIAELETLAAANADQATQATLAAENAVQRQIRMDQQEQDAADTSATACEDAIARLVKRYEQQTIEPLRREIRTRLQRQTALADDARRKLGLADGAMAGVEGMSVDDIDALRRRTLEQLTTAAPR